MSGRRARPAVAHGTVIGGSSVPAPRGVTAAARGQATLRGRAAAEASQRAGEP